MDVIQQLAEIVEQRTLRIVYFALVLLDLYYFIENITHAEYDILKNMFYS